MISTQKQESRPFSITALGEFSQRAKDLGRIAKVSLLASAITFGLTYLPGSALPSLLDIELPVLSYVFFLYGSIQAVRSRMASITEVTHEDDDESYLVEVNLDYRLDCAMGRVHQQISAPA